MKKVFNWVQVWRSWRSTLLKASRATLLFCLGQPSRSTLFTRLEHFASASGNDFSTIPANLLPVTVPKYCSQRTTPQLYDIPTIKLAFLQPSFLPLVVIFKPSDFLRHSRTEGAFAWSNGFVLYTKPVPSR